MVRGSSDLVSEHVTKLRTRWSKDIRIQNPSLGQDLRGWLEVLRDLDSKAVRRISREMVRGSAGLAYESIRGRSICTQRELQSASQSKASMFVIFDVHKGQKEPHTNILFTTHQASSSLFSLSFSAHVVEKSSLSCEFEVCHRIVYLFSRQSWSSRCVVTFLKDLLNLYTC